jgi:hypothetical protein
MAHDRTKAKAGHDILYTSSDFTRLDFAVIEVT